MLNGVPESNMVVLSARSEVLPSVGSACQVAVLRQEDFEASQAVNRGSFCELQRIGDPLYAGMIGMAVSDKWAWSLRYIMTTIDQEGHVQSALNAYRPPDFCSAVAAEAEASAEPPSLQVEGMAGPFILTAIITSFGLLVHFLKASVDARRARRRAAEAQAVVSAESKEEAAVGGPGAVVQREDLPATAQNAAARDKWMFM